MDRIELRQSRDFGATINVIFEFIRKNWRPLGRSLVFIVGPVLLIATVVGGFSVQRMFSTMDSWQGETLEDPFSFYDGAWDMIALSSAVGIVCTIFLFGVMCGYVRLYVERAPEPIEVDDVWREVRRTFWRVAVTLLAVIVITCLPLAIGLLPGVALDSIVLIPIGILLAVIPCIYLSIALSITTPMRIEEEIGLVESIGRSIRLIRGRWWFTLWIFVVMSIILMFASIIFQLPLQLAAGIAGASGETPSTTVLVIGIAFSTIGSYLLYSILALACSVVYYNLVEQKEGVGMIDRINEIGAEPMGSTGEGGF